MRDQYAELLRPRSHFPSRREQMSLLSTSKLSAGLWVPEALQKQCSSQPSAARTPLAGHKTACRILASPALTASRHGASTSRPRASAVVAAAVAASPQMAAPPAAETARTVVQLVGSGTLSTLDSSTGAPIGTYITYVLDLQGLPILRLRKDAVHTRNLKANPTCSLFILAPLQPVRSVARITLIGAVEEVSDEEKANAQERHAAANADSIGVDAPQPDDVFMRLRISKTFYVGGLGSVRSPRRGNTESMLRKPLISCVHPKM